MARRAPTFAQSPATAPTFPLWALVAAFILSGAAGLIYESVWSRYLGLFVGHGAYAQIIVLVIFMGGVVLFIVMAILLPIFELNQLVK